MNKQMGGSIAKHIDVQSFLIAKIIWNVGCTKMIHSGTNKDASP